jgi:hypothetical protein
MLLIGKRRGIDARPTCLKTDVSFADFICITEARWSVHRTLPKNTVSTENGADNFPQRMQAGAAERGNRRAPCAVPQKLCLPGGMAGLTGVLGFEFDDGAGCTFP